MKILIELSPEEVAWLKALSIEYGTTPERLLQSFASDVTGSLRSGGSNEMELADAWLNCRHTLKGKLGPGEGRRLGYLQAEAIRHRSAEEAVFRAQLARTWTGTAGGAA